MSANHLGCETNPASWWFFRWLNGDSVTPFVSDMLGCEPDEETPDLDLEDAQVVSLDGDVLLAYPGRRAMPC